MKQPFVAPEEMKHNKPRADDKKSKTVQWDNVIEGICSFWFLILSVIVLILFLSGIAVNVIHKKVVIYNHAFCIPLAVCQISLIILCAYYCSGFQWKNVKDLIKFNKFWVQFLFCSLFNFISFLLLVIHLSMRLATNKIDKLHAWFYANALVYLFSTIGIPLPAISIKLHHKYKPRQNGQQQITAINNGGSYTPPPPTRENSVLLQYEAGEQKLVSVNEADVETNYEENVPCNRVASWLQDIELGEYYKNFEEHGITNWDDIQRLSSKQTSKLESQLIQIGIKKVGHRNKMTECIKKLNPRQPTMSLSFAIESYSVSVSASIAGSKPIFRDNIIKGAILVCYFVNFVAYICNPLLNHQSYLLLNDILYPGYDGSVFWLMVHNINQIFLRTFLGMSITSVFFMIVTELSDKKITSTRFCVIWLIWNDKKNKYWIFILTLSVISILFEVFTFRHLIQVNIDTQDNHLVDMIVNSIWTVINLSVSAICISFTITFGGIYVKTKRDFGRDSGRKTPKSPIIAFVLELIALSVCYALYIAFMFLYDHNYNDDSSAKSWDTIRQSSILILTISQFVSLWQYFGAIFIKYISNDHQHIYANFGYAFSFSLSAAMLFILTHFLASYDRWRKDQWNYPNGDPKLNLRKDKHADPKERFTYMSEDIKREGITASIIDQEPHNEMSNSMITNTNE